MQEKLIKATKIINKISGIEEGLKKSGKGKAWDMGGWVVIQFNDGVVICEQRCALYKSSFYVNEVLFLLWFDVHLQRLLISTDKY